MKETNKLEPRKSNLLLTECFYRATFMFLASVLPPLPRMWLLPTWEWPPSTELVLGPMGGPVRAVPACHGMSALLLMVGKSVLYHFQRLCDIMQHKRDCLCCLKCLPLFCSVVRPCIVKTSMHWKCSLVIAYSFTLICSLSTPPPVPP